MTYGNIAMVQRGVTETVSIYIEVSEVVSSTVLQNAHKKKKKNLLCLINFKPVD